MFGGDRMVSHPASGPLAVGDRLHIGDRQHVGGVILEVTAPRIPCWKLAQRMGDPGFVKRFRGAERPGVDRRVVREGRIQAGEPVTLEPYTGERVTVAEIFRDYYEPARGPGGHPAFSCLGVCLRFSWLTLIRNGSFGKRSERIKTMNETLGLLRIPRPIHPRPDEERPISVEDKDLLLQATLRGPTVGNMMLYSIIEVNDQAAKDTLARTCDNQPFIARAPLALLFLADYQRWFDYFTLSGVEELIGCWGEPLRKPQEGDLFLACNDVWIVAQTAVVAAAGLPRIRLLLHRRHHGELRSPS